MYKNMRLHNEIDINATVNDLIATMEKFKKEFQQ
jgi:hypothetical protein